MKLLEDDTGRMRRRALPTLAMLVLALATCKSSTAPGSASRKFTLSQSNVTVLESSYFDEHWVPMVSSGPAGTSSQKPLSYEVTSRDSALFDVHGQPAISSGGMLTFTTVPDSFGIDTATVTAIGNGGAANGGGQTFTITVTHVNQPPRFTVGANQIVWHDAGPQTVTNWATNVSPGPANERGQTLTFELTSSDSTLLSVQPILSASGTLTFTPDTAERGTDTVSVTAKDNGGTANGGVDSTTHVFTITVAPTFTMGVNEIVWHEAGPQTTLHWATDIVGAPASDSGQTTAFTVRSSDSGLFGVPPAISPDGTLTFTPDTAADGTDTVSVTLQDNSTATGRVESGSTRTFTIAVVPMALVTNVGDDTASSSVSVIDVGSGAVIHTIADEWYPLDAAFAPNGKTGYVVDDGKSTVAVIDVATDTVRGYNTVLGIDVAPDTVSRSIPVGSEPRDIALTPDGTKAYVTGGMGYTVTAMDVATGTAKTIVDGSLYDVGFVDVACSPDGATAYVPNSHASDVWVIDVATDGVVQKIPVGSAPHGVAFTPDGTKAYVANSGDSTVSVIDVATGTDVQTIPVGSQPWGVTVTPDGTKAYVTNYGGNSVSVIDVATGTVIQTIPVGVQPMHVAFAPDGTKAYVTNHRSHTVSVIDVATGTVIQSIWVGARPWDVVIR